MAHEKLVLEAFEKAFSIQKSNGAQESKKAAAELLSDYLDEHYQFSFTERRLRDYYTAAVNGEEVIVTQQTVRDGLANFLGAENYQTWAAPDDRSELAKPKFTLAFILAFFRRNSTTTSFIIIGLLILFGINLFNKERWMIWQDDRFVEVPYDKDEFDAKQFFVLDKQRVETFKKISPTCETEFFNQKDQPKIWYGKNAKKELEYFTAPGNHPETAKPLKPITKYMIAKYICPK